VLLEEKAEHLVLNR